VFKKWLAPWTDQVYALLRILTGMMFSFHGMQKLFGILSPHQPEVGSQIWCGGVIELVAGLAIAIGLFTSCAAFVASGTMAVAYVQFHWRFAFDSGFIPTINKGELAVVYALVFLYIACRGGGRFSVDAVRGKKAES
jgi:putative oxidoreductase